MKAVIGDTPQGGCLLSLKEDKRWGSETEGERGKEVD